jgi:hypothetical protein
MSLGNPNNGTLTMEETDCDSERMKEGSPESEDWGDVSPMTSHRLRKKDNESESD